MSAQSRLTQATQAVKEQLKARVAITGPSGAGKTYTALQWATAIAESAPILVIDSERRSASLYADRFSFDSIDWTPPYDPDELASTIADAAGKYAVIVIDSISHWWEGEGGVLDIVDGAAPRGNTFAGWKTGTPKLRSLIEAVVSADAHVIVTMRSKMEYVLEANDKGKQEPRKVGMAPVMRQGVEYEFTVIGDMDLDNVMTISKSRCDTLSGRTIASAKLTDAAGEFLAWLNDGEPKATPAQLGEIRALVSGIDDQHQRNAVKRAFKAQFGDTAHLPAARVDEAKAWIASQWSPVEAEA